MPQKTRREPLTRSLAICALGRSATFENSCLLSSIRWTPTPSSFSRVPTAACERWTACWLQRRWFSLRRYVTWSLVSTRKRAECSFRDVREHSGGNMTQPACWSPRVSCYLLLPRVHRYLCTCCVCFFCGCSFIRSVTLKTGVMQSVYDAALSTNRLSDVPGLRVSTP